MSQSFVMYDTLFQSQISHISVGKTIAKDVCMTKNLNKFPSKIPVLSLQNQFL